MQNLSRELCDLTLYSKFFERLMMYGWLEKQGRHCEDSRKVGITWMSSVICTVPALILPYSMMCLSVKKGSFIKFGRWICKNKTRNWSPMSVIIVVMRLWTFD